MSLTESHIIALIKNISNERFLKTERGYQGQLISSIEQSLIKTKFFPVNTIVEQEYQKTMKHHDITQRPDIIIHIPMEANETIDRKLNNFYVIALKLNANQKSALEDYDKLDEMFNKLNYPEGVFINIRSYPDIYLDNYKGHFKDRIHEISIGIQNNNISLRHAKFEKDEIIIAEK